MNRLLKMAFTRSVGDTLKLAKIRREKCYLLCLPLEYPSIAGEFSGLTCGGGRMRTFEGEILNFARLYLVKEISGKKWQDESEK